MKTFEQVLTGITQQSGKTLEQVEHAAKERYFLTRARMKELDIKSPFLKFTVLPSNTFCKERSENFCSWESTIPNGKGFKFYKLLILGSICIEQDGRIWYHVSLSRIDEMPSYKDLCFVKKYFVGEDRWAIQVFPKKSEHVSDHDRTLHLWTCLEADILPDFRKNGTIWWLHKNSRVLTIQLP